MKDVLYRYHDTLCAPYLDEFDNPDGPSRVVVSLETYEILRKTPKGAWVQCFGKDKFVLLAAKKRFACPTKEEALKSFVARKSTQRRILSDKILVAESAIREAKKIAEEEGIDPLGEWAKDVITKFRTGKVFH